MIVKYLSGGLVPGSWIKKMLIGNIAMFLPFGFFLPFITETLSKKRILTIAIVVPIVIEVLQLLVGRSFDVDDLLLNFLGILFGFFVGNGVKKLWEALSAPK